MMDSESLASESFEAEIIEWRGPAPSLFAPVPDEHFGEIRYVARAASYRRGVVPVPTTIGITRFTTSLFPRNGSYLLPIEVAVQRPANVGPGDRVNALIQVFGR